MRSSQSPGFRSSGTILVSLAFWANARPGRPISGGRNRQAAVPTAEHRMKSLGRDNIVVPPAGMGWRSRFKLPALINCVGGPGLGGWSVPNGRMIHQRLVVALTGTFDGARF